MQLCWITPHPHKHLHVITYCWCKGWHSNRAFFFFLNRNYKSHRVTSSWQPNLSGIKLKRWKRCCGCALQAKVHQQLERTVPLEHPCPACGWLRHIKAQKNKTNYALNTDHKKQLQELPPDVSLAFITLLLPTVIQQTSYSARALQTGKLDVISFIIFGKTVMLLTKLTCRFGNKPVNKTPTSPHDGSKSKRTLLFLTDIQS